MKALCVKNETSPAESRIYHCCLRSAGLEDIACDYLDLSKSQNMTWLDFSKQPAAQNAKCYQCMYKANWEK